MFNAFVIPRRKPFLLLTKTIAQLGGVYRDEITLLIQNLAEFL